MTEATTRPIGAAGPAQCGPLVGSAADGRSARWVPPMRRILRFEAAEEISKPQLAALLSDPGRPLREFAHRPVKLSHTSLIVEAELQLAGGRVHVAYKRSRPRSWWRALLGALRTSRAARAWQLGRFLTEHGVPTAQPLFMLEQPSGNYLATQWIEGSTNLHLYLWQLAERSTVDRRTRLRQAGASAARLVAALHAAGCSHRDLKALNLVVGETPTDVDTWLVDLDGVSEARMTARRRTRNLGRLAASLDAHPWITRTQRLRGLLDYLHSSGIPVGAWKDFWRAIDLWRRRNRARIARRGRPMS
ncbi:MAG TPA: lipopolysaccharide kinase InaA family protein [Pirellulales bacterium]